MIFPIQRKETRQLYIDTIPIGGGAPIVVQSMTTTFTHDIEATLSQIESLANAGCHVVRIAVPDKQSAHAVAELVQYSRVPLIADIHFDYTLALTSIANGIAGIRINPGTLANKAHVKELVTACKEKHIPIRIGVNGGSLERHIIAQYGITPQAMVMSALEHVAILEELDFYDIKISLKSSNVSETVTAYQMLSEKCDYPLHIGITEAGTLRRGTVKSSIGIGMLLVLGIGDTLRVSLTADPVEEVRVAWDILSSLDIQHQGPNIISCPTCGRTEIDLMELVAGVEEHAKKIKHSFTIAVMGCPVNGLGEAKSADIGVAGGKDKGIIFKKGIVIRSVNGNENILPIFIEELDKYVQELES